MANVRIELNHNGIRQLLRSDEVFLDLERRAEQIADEAGDGFEHDASLGANRARAMVWTGTYEARRAEATDRALTRAIDAGRA